GRLSSAGPRPFGRCCGPDGEEPFPIAPSFVRRRSYVITGVPTGIRTLDDTVCSRAPHCSVPGHMGCATGFEPPPSCLEDTCASDYATTALVPLGRLERPVSLRSARFKLAPSPIAAQRGSGR